MTKSVEEIVLEIERQVNELSNFISMSDRFNVGNIDYLVLAKRNLEGLLSWIKSNDEKGE